MSINGNVVSLVGKVCMDMCFIDVTDIECSEADDVIIFDNNAALCQMAENAETIPYEVLTSISSRVKRVYFWE